MSRPRPRPPAPPPPPPRRRWRFSIGQLMVVIAAVGVLSFLAAPIARERGLGHAAVAVGLFLFAIYVAMRVLNEMVQF